MKILILLSLLVLTACATTHQKVNVEMPNGTDKNDYVVNDRACSIVFTTINGNTYRDAEFYKACMEKRGYKFSFTEVSE